MLVEPVRHLVEREPDILEADLLAGDVERHVRNSDRASRASRASAPCRRRDRHRTGAPPADADGCWRVPARPGWRPPTSRCRCSRTEDISAGCRRSGNSAAPSSLALAGAAGSPVQGRWPAAGHHVDDHGTRGFFSTVGGHERADAIERFGGDAPAVAQARYELSVVDGSPPEGEFGYAGPTAIVGDFLQQAGSRHAFPPERFRRAQDDAADRCELVNWMISH